MFETLALIGALVVIIILTTILTEVEHFGWATFVLVVSLVAGQVFHKLDILGFATEHTGQLLMYVFFYVVAGVGWSFVKWFSWLHNFRDQYREYKGKFLTSKGLTGDTLLPVELVKEFGEWLNGNGNYRYSRGSVNLGSLSELQRPRAKDNKSRIVAWASFWPLSLVGTLLNDPVRRLFSWIFRVFSSLYQRMADYVFRNDVELK